VIGNSVKAGVRFVSYDHFKSILADAEVIFVGTGNKELAEFI
jgi:hypothetical protein